MTTDMTIENLNPKTIEINNPAVMTVARARKEQSEKRKEDFFKQLEKAREEDAKMSQPQKQVEEIEELQPKVEVKPEIETPVVPEQQVVHEEDDEDNEIDSKVIPKKRLDKEIEKRKKLEEDLWKAREEKVRLEAEFNLLTQGLNKLNKAEENKIKETEIDPLDPDAHNLYINKINELERKFNDQNNHLTEHQQKQLVAQTIDRQAAEFSKTNPDFGEAYNYLLEVESKKARMLGLSEEQSEQFALQALQPVALQAYNNGKNVAEVAYNMAKAYGYNSKKPTNVNGAALEPDLEKVGRNMQKSHSALNEIQGIPTNIAPDASAVLELKGFIQNTAGHKGRGIDRDKFREVLNKIENKSRY